MTWGELAAKTKVAERCAREWLSHQAASGYLDYNAVSGKFTLPPEQAMVFAESDSPVYLQGAFDLAVSLIENEAKVEPAFRSGKGVGWGDQAPCLFCTVGRFFRPSYQNNLVTSWLPALDGVVAKLESGANVADVGCGHGFSTIFMAKAFPRSKFVGYDFHPASIEQARAHAEQHGVGANAKFEVAMAGDFPGKDLDLVTFFDCLHDNVTRRDMAEMGFAPSGRLFEAAYCGACLITDGWPGLGAFFVPGEEILVAHSTHDVLAALSLDEADLRAIGQTARARVLRDHTSDKRAAEFEAHVASARSEVAPA